MVGLSIIQIALFEDDVARDTKSFTDLVDRADTPVMAIGALILIIGIGLLAGTSSGGSSRYEGFRLPASNSSA